MLKYLMKPKLYLEKLSAFPPHPQPLSKLERGDVFN